MIIPAILKPGDRVAVIAPSGVVNKKVIENAISILKEWGLIVGKGKYLYNRHGFFAGTDYERLEDLQNAIDDGEVRSVFCARGGYGLSRIIDRVNFKALASSPKWIIGYSDITLLGLYVNRYADLPFIHGEMVVNYLNSNRSPETMTTLHKILFEGLPGHKWESDITREGRADAVLTGGNLAMICSVTGTEIKEFLMGKILFIEEVGESLYRLDRMMMSLRLSGILAGLKGLIVGRLTDIEESSVKFGMSAEEIIMKSVEQYDIPVAFNFPAGHSDDNRAFYLGRSVKFNVRGRIANLEYI